MQQDTPNRPFTLLDLLKEQARDLYDAEVAFDNALVELEASVASQRLGDDLRTLQENVQDNINCLEDICHLLGVPPDGITCHAMKGLIREAKETTAEYENSAVRDAAIIANAQRIVHYEIAGFGTAHAFASKLKLDEVAAILDRLAKAAKDSDHSLTKTAVGSWLSEGINDEAAAEPGI